MRSEAPHECTSGNLGPGVSSGYLDAVATAADPEAATPAAAIPCLTEVGPRGVEPQRRWRILSAPDLGAGRVSRTRSASTTARRRQPSASWPRDVGGDGGGEAVLGGVVDDCADPPDPAAGGLELGEVHLRVVPRRVPEEIDRLRRHPKRRDGGRSWRRLPPRGQVIGGLPGATEEGDGADPTGAGRGHRLTARADR